jgi:hypothetical protein
VSVYDADELGRTLPDQARRRPREERGFLDVGGKRWGRFGFAVLDLDGPRIGVRYRDDLGRVTRTEEVM